MDKGLQKSMDIFSLGSRVETVNEEWLSLGDSRATMTPSIGVGLRKSIERMSIHLRDETKDECKWGLQCLLWDMDDPSIQTIDDYAPGSYGIELPDCLLWMACIVDSDISYPEGSEYFTGRPSEPAFQDMKFIAIP